MVSAYSCAWTAVSAFLATWLHRNADALRQRECCYEAIAKRGTVCRELMVETCFVPLLTQVAEQWEGIQMALEATTLGLRFPALALSVVYRGCAMLVAGTVLAATAQHAWCRVWWRIRRSTRLGWRPAPQYGRDIPAHRPGARRPSQGVGARAGDDLAGDGHRLQRPLLAAPG